MENNFKDERLNIYIDRLYNEWKMHGKIIICVDFDSTLSTYHTIDNQFDINRTIEIIKVCKQTGCYIVIHTNCGTERYDDIKGYCSKIGIEVDCINETPLDLPYGKSGSKPYANIFIDDRASLPSSLDILETALYRYRCEKNKIGMSDVA